jgi:hypothetical protein
MVDSAAIALAGCDGCEAVKSDDPSAVTGVADCEVDAPIGQVDVRLEWRLPPRPLT